MLKYQFDEYEKQSNSKLANSYDMFEYLNDFSKFTKSYDEWKEDNMKKYSSKGRTSVESLVDMSYYNDIKTKTGLSDEALIYANIDYNKNTEEVDIIKDSDKSADENNPYIAKEKNRIKKQKESKEYSREDHFGIGTVYLKIPPMHINITEEKHNFRYNSLRSKGETIATSGRSTIRIDLDIMFNGLDDTNSKLRALLAQFKTTPFLPIENEYINNIINPFKARVTPDEAIKTKEEQIKSLKKAEGLVDDMLSLSSQASINKNSMLENLSDLHKNGNLDQDMYTKIASRYLWDYESIPIQEKDDSDYIIHPDGFKEFSFSRWLSRQIKTPVGINNDFISFQRTLAEIDKLEREISIIKEKSSELQSRAIEERFLDKQIAGVLSQIAISTIAGYPETLGCRISMYVFNYDVYTENFAFIEGDDINKWTTDITRCDLFIDWYTKRFLSENTDSLKQVEGNPSMAVVYADNIERNTKSPGLSITPSDPIDLSTDGSYVSGVTVSFRNIIQFLPILSHKTPTCQYLGSFNTDVQINLEVVSSEKLNKISRMVDRVGQVSRLRNRESRNAFLIIRNEILAFCGLDKFMIESFSSETIPSNPGTYAVSLALSEYKTGTEELQKLKRKGVVTDDDINKTAELWLEYAYRYASDPDNNKHLIHYYDDLMSDRGGYLKGDDNMVSSFIVNSAGGVEHNKLRTELVNELVPKKLGIPQNVINNARAVLSYKSDPYIPIVSAASFLYSRHQGNQRLRKDITKTYVNAIINSMNGVDGGEFFLNNKKRLGEVLVATHRGDIVRKINSPRTNQILAHDLEVFRAKKKNDIRNKNPLISYCYPDLELPKYGELSHGHKHILQNRDLGIPGNPSKLAQDLDSEIDPDFFFYKGQLWRIIDDKHETFSGVSNAIENFKQLTASNRAYPGRCDMDEEEFEEILSDKLSSKGEEEEGEYEEDNLGEKVEDNIIENIQGKPIKVVSVLSGDKVNITYNGKDSTVKLLGYSAQELGGEKYEAAKALLEKIIGNNDVYVALGNNYSKDKDGNILAHLTVAKNGEVINLTDEMMKHKYSVGLSHVVDLNNPLLLSDRNRWYDCHEAFVHPKSQMYRKAIVHLISSTMPLAGPVGRMYAKVSDWAVSLFGQNHKDVEAFFDDTAGVVLRGFIRETKKLTHKGKAKKDLGVVDLSKNIIKNFFDLEHSNNEFGYNRFDRYSDENIELISNKIREHQKDDVLRMVRAYPTFKIYFIEEDMPEWGLLDDFYEYNAVHSIDIIKSRKEAADTAIIQFLNTKGTLDTSRFGLHTKGDERLDDRGLDESLKFKDQDTEREQNLEEFIMQPGTRIQIRMGYSSDPDLLDVIFNGMVAELNGGDIITVVAQSYGVELLHRVRQSSFKVQSASAYKILHDIIKTPEVLHFGKFVYVPFRDDRHVNLGRRRVFNPDTGKFQEPSWWREWGPAKFIIGFREDERGSNINHPEHTWWYDISHGGEQRFITRDKTVWDVFQDMARRMPGYIATVLPFDARSTIFFGPADWTYWYTSQNLDEENIYDRDYIRDMSKSDDEKIKETGLKRINMSNDMHSGSGVISNINLFLSHLDHYEYHKELQLIKDNINYRVNKDKQGWVMDQHFASSKKSLKNFLMTKAISSLNSNSRDDYNKILGSKFLVNYLSDNNDNNFVVKEGNIIYLTDDARNKIEDLEYYSDSVGNIMTRSQATKHYGATRTNKLQEYHPSKKIVRSYHLKDSLHHIISNNVIASERYMYNKVAVEFGKEYFWAASSLVGKPSAPDRVNVQVSRTLWKEKIRERHIQERNARNKITAWGYGLSNLWLGMRDMYQGELVVLGDPSIKPYDFVFINDYYTEMHGPVEVEQVVHHFSHETGFITTIKPDLVCYVNNIIAQGAMLVANSYYDVVTKLMMGVHSKTFLLKSNLPSDIIFYLTQFDSSRREPIGFTPLMYAGRPYIAGVQGLRIETVYEGLKGWVRNRFKHREKVWEAVKLNLDIANNTWSARGEKR